MAKHGEAGLALQTGSDAVVGCFPDVEGQEAIKWWDSRVLKKCANRKAGTKGFQKVKISNQFTFSRRD
jgi:hypothetical protein